MSSTTAPASPPVPDVELTVSSSKKPARPHIDRAAKNAEMSRVAAEMRERQAAPQEPETPTAPPPPPREDVDSVVWELTDHRKIHFGPPPGVSLTMRIAMCIPDATTNPVIDRLARVLMSVRSVNDVPPRPISNLVDLTRMANEIGDVGIDELHWVFEKHWGNLRVSDTQLLKKNLRG